MQQTLLRASSLVSLLILLVFLPTTASAVTNTCAYVPNIEGESDVKGHENWIDVMSLSQTLSPGWTTSSCTVSLVKRLDKAGPLLWAAAVTNQLFNHVIIETDRVGGMAGAATYYVITLQNARITGMVTNSGGTSSEPFTETVTFKAQSIVLTYYPMNPDGSVGAPVSRTITCP